MPAVEEVAEEDFVRLSQLYGRYARVNSHDMSEQFAGPPDVVGDRPCPGDRALARRARLVQR